MIIEPSSLEPWFAWLNWATLAVCSSVAIRFAPWWDLAARAVRQHLFFAAVVILPALWSMAIPMPGSVTMHLFYMTALTLVFGWHLAVVGGAVALLALFLLGAADLGSLPINLTINVLIPATVTLLVLRLCDRLPRSNLFVYLMGPAFAGAMLASYAALATGWQLVEVQPGEPITLSLLALLIFPEGFINGTITTALVVFRPHWVRTYDERRYLGP